ncbi:MAG: UvrD-helicase domain-containing protein, partial [Gammaproteobacteria bacterium]|nr:UvrD-helicase domain-containing protein [Gammaproteobacteria bacterium]
MQLNKPQQQAVAHISGPVLVLAGAGSGKTSVITEKIVHLIKNCHFAPDTLAAVTFTNKASREMAERLQKRLGKDIAAQIRSSTFHTLGMAILREDIDVTERNQRFSIFDEQDGLGL